MFKKEKGKEKSKNPRISGRFSRFLWLTPRADTILRDVNKAAATQLAWMDTKHPQDECTCS